jgi:hypothetical protein
LSGGTKPPAAQALGQRLDPRVETIDLIDTDRIGAYRGALHSTTPFAGGTGHASVSL